MRLIRLWPDGTQFDFMRLRRLSFPFSAFLSLLTVALFVTFGLNFGIDFRGGTLMELQAKSGQANVGTVRQTAEGFGFGRRLYDTMLEWLFTSGAEQVWLSTEPGTRAERFYVAAQWQPCGRDANEEARYSMSRQAWLARYLASELS